MSFLLILLCSFTSVTQGVLKKLYSNRSGKGTFTFNTILTLAALMFFAVLSFGKPYSLDTIPYAMAFGAAYAIATVTEYEALTHGPLAITSLIMSYSLIIPTVCGVLFWNESLSFKQYAGLAFLFLSLFLIRSKDATDAQKKMQFKWLVLVLIAFVTNGLCSVVQRQQQRVFGSKYDESFMVMALICVVTVLFAVCLIRERKSIVSFVKAGAFLSFACGIFNGATNLLVMLTLVLIPASTFFPVLSALSLILSTLAAVFLFNERLVPRQFAALLLGCIALILIN
ncbi:MAG: hypothetical protein E7534_04150 [Ruminococcaceae bacterium]|nr:hypothetical protein [Oscillospiraceae bacterium]